MTVNGQTHWRAPAAQTGMRDQFISAMNKLGDQNMAQKRPNAVVEFIFHSHPSVQHRIDRARAWLPQEK